MPNLLRFSLTEYLIQFLYQKDSKKMLFLEIEDEEFIQKIQFGTKNLGGSIHKF